MIIFVKNIIQESDFLLSKPVTWDEYRLMIGRKYSIYNQSRARCYSELDNDSIADIIDYIDKIYLSKSNYTLNVFSDANFGSTFLEYLREIFSFDLKRSNGFVGEIDRNLLQDFIRIKDEGVRAGISF